MEKKYINLTVKNCCFNVETYPVISEFRPRDIFSNTFYGELHVFGRHVWRAATRMASSYALMNTSRFRSSR